MFVLNDDLSIYATRGDIVFFSVSAEQKGETYTFKAGDVMRVKVYGKKNAKNVVLQKDFPIVADCTEVEIFLDETDTKFGGIINKPVDYWYEVELNPLSDPQTIIGYDEDGPKVFRLLPEGADVPEDEPNVEPEDIPLVDDELDLTSPRPVENQAIARAVVQLRAAFDETKADITKKTQQTATETANAKVEIAVERARINNLVAGTTPDGSEVTDIRVGADGKTYEAAGTAVRDQFNHTRNLVSDMQNGYFNFGKLHYGQYKLEEGVFYGNSAKHLSSEIIKTGNDLHIIRPNGKTMVRFNYSNGVFVNRQQVTETTISSYIVYPNSEYRVMIGNDGFETDITYEEAHSAYATILRAEDTIEQIGKFFDKCILKDNGALEYKTNYTYATTGYIKVFANKDYAVSGKVKFVAKYDLNKNLTSFVTADSENYHLVGFDGYVRFTFYPESINTANIRNVTYVSEWVGSKFVSFGDSITWQDGKAYGNSGEIARGYQTVIKEKLSLAGCENYGVSGRPVANGTANGAGTVSTVQTADYSNYDLCIIAGGTNDFKLNVPLGNIEDSTLDDTTFYGAYRKMVEHILTQNPTLRICLFTPLQRDNGGYNTNTVNKAGHKLIDYVRAIVDIGEMYALPVCNMYANSGITKLNLSLYTIDGLHPNDIGYERMGGYAAAFINNVGK